MKSVSPVLLWFLWALVVLAIIVAMAMYDRLIRWLRTNRNDEWEGLGRPTGYLSKPQGGYFWRSDVRKTALSHRLVFETPKWVSEKEDLMRTLRIYRGAAIFAFIGIAAFCIMIWT
jgi:hypothetical protein